MAARRNAPPTRRADLELTGFGVLGFAAVLAMIMWSRSAHAGAIGYFVRAPLGALFGPLATWFPVLVCAIGAFFFLEVGEPMMILSLGIASVAYYLLFDTAVRGGVIGLGLGNMLEAFVGDYTGTILWILGTILTFGITGISIKRALGWLIVQLRSLSLPHLPNLSLLPNHETTSARGQGKRAKATATAWNPANDMRERFTQVLGSFSSRTADDDADQNDDAPPSSPTGGGRRGSGGPSPALRGARPATVIDVEPSAVRTVHEEVVWPSDETVVEGRIVTGERPQPTPVRPQPTQRAAHPLYRLPDLSLFDLPLHQNVDESNRGALLVETLASFGVGAEVINTVRGPAITRYELKPARGVKISRISALADDLALALAAMSIRIEAPIPGRSAVGIEVPNSVVSIVALREILEAVPERATIPPLTMALGKDITGRPVWGDLCRMPHLLVAGATGAGKSVCLNGIIASLLASATPDQVQMLMIDPKRVELTVYNGIPHLVKDVITDARLAAGALLEITKEMDTRYERFAKVGVRKIEEYNEKFPNEPLPYVVIIIDELADLMLVAPAKVETTICRLAQLARATGIHLIVATQRPSVDVITGIIKANIPSRIAFAVSSQVDSRTILDMGGAERLLGRGDMLYLPIDAPKPRRTQGAFVTGEEISRLVAFWAAQARPKNLVEVEDVSIEDDESGKGLDPLSYDAAKFIIETNYASTAQLQSQFQIGHPRAVRLMKGLEEMRVVGPHEGTKPRKILIGIAELEIMASRFAPSDGATPIPE